MLWRIALKKYGHRQNQSSNAVTALLKDIKNVVRDENNFTIESDRNGMYYGLVSQELPFAHHVAHNGSTLRKIELSMRKMDLADAPVDYTTVNQPQTYWKKRQKNGKIVVRAYDHLFDINQKCAVLRARISRLRRHTWGFTQKLENLVHHLWIFIAHHNQYALPK